MAAGETTSWNLIRAAAAGSDTDRERFARVYGKPIRAYLAHRWRGSPMERDLDDAVQEVFVECFRPGGALARLEEERCSSFRAYLFGVVRNIARRSEQLSQRRGAVASTVDLDALPDGADTLSRHFDRAWARNVLRVAVQTLAAEAAQEGPEAQRRLEILRLRFQQGIPIRDIARRWQADATLLHRQFTRAKRDFQRVLRQILAPYPDAPREEVDREIALLLDLLRQR